MRNFRNFNVWKKSIELVKEVYELLETQFLIIQELDLIKKDELNKVLALLDKEQKMLNGFIEKLKANG